MSTVVKRHCRTHGGYFNSPSKPGRPPVRCDENSYPCDRSDAPAIIAARTESAKGIAARVAQTLKGKMPEPAVDVKAPKAVVAPRAKANPSLPKAQQAKGQLEALGWEAKGRAWIETGDQGQRWQMASITASRGIELLIVVWRDGFQHSSEYSLWDVEHPAANGKPVSNLPFDPDEIPDKELAQLLAGTRVTWFNRLGQKEEKGYVNPNTIEIVHSYNGHGDETPGMRVVRFSEAEGHGFRAFRLDALLKVG